VEEFFDNQSKIWLTKGGEIIQLPPDELNAVTAKVSTIAEDLSKDNPDLNKAVKLVFDVAKQHK
jgi:hypothetical protein